MSRYQASFSSPSTVRRPLLSMSPERAEADHLSCAVGTTGGLLGDGDLRDRGRAGRVVG